MDYTGFFSKFDSIDRQRRIQVFRVVTDNRDHRGARILEKGPWLPSRQEADHWVGTLCNLGYKAYVEGHGGDIAAGSPDEDFAEALKNMA